ncbi:MAG: hypothetical protein QM820_54010 [Minicystis sp.]
MPADASLQRASVSSSTCFTDTSSVVLAMKIGSPLMRSGRFVPTSPSWPSSRPMENAVARTSP